MEIVHRKRLLSAQSYKRQNKWYRRCGPRPHSPRECRDAHTLFPPWRGIMGELKEMVDALVLNLEGASRHAFTRLEVSRFDVISDCSRADIQGLRNLLDPQPMLVWTTAFFALGHRFFLSPQNTRGTLTRAHSNIPLKQRRLRGGRSRWWSKTGYAC